MVSLFMGVRKKFSKVGIETSNGVGNGKGISLPGLLEDLGTVGSIVRFGLWGGVGTFLVSCNTSGQALVER